MDFRTGAYVKLGQILNNCPTAHYTLFQILPVVLLLVPLVNIVQYIWETMWGSCTNNTENTESSGALHV